jgi:hypothetical protein
MKTAVCTLFEGDYHYGVGDLVNSLFVQGFRGIVWAGYKGNLPIWAQPIRAEADYQEFVVAPDCAIRFVKIDSYKFLSNYKADFMLDILNRLQPELEALFYFDPDIVSKCLWSTYERWVKCGVALCEDGFDYMPVNHPDRIAWKKLSQRLGYQKYRQSDRTYNTGFVGVKQSDKPIIALWQQYLERLESEGLLNLKQFIFPKQYPYFDSDQCVFNEVMTLTDIPLSTMDRLAMDLGGSPTRNIMSHAAGGDLTKPWRKAYLAKVLLKGETPTLTDKAYWKHAQTPIQLYSPWYYRWKRMDLLCGSALARIIKRPG